MNQKNYPFILLREVYLFPKMKKIFLLKKKESIKSIENADQNLIVVTYKGSQDGVLAKFKKISSNEFEFEGISFVVIDKIINKEQVSVVDRETSYELALGEKLQGDLLRHSIMDLLVSQVTPVMNDHQLKEIKENKELFSFYETILAQINFKQDISKKLFSEKNIIKGFKIIQSELEKTMEPFPKITGFSNFFSSESKYMSEYEEKLKNKTLPSDVKEEVLKEISKLDKMSFESQESFVIKQYLDFLISLPWGNKKPEKFSLELIQASLDKTHFGLNTVKDRILDYIFHYDKKILPPILCLVGPYGVGKTTFVQSLAQAMNRPFEKIHLGGMSDESEIRGHRKTYVGASSGKILQALKRAQVDNPIILLDEIDKVGNSMKGDVYSSLMEALDPTQQKQFKDHYLNFSYDISDVFFIATANDINSIPRALRDRMEFLFLEGFSFREKIYIAKNYIIPKLEKEYHLSKSFIDDIFLEKLILHHQQESGVRQLEKFLRTCLERSLRKNISLILSFNQIQHLIPDNIFPQLDQHPGSFHLLAYTDQGGLLIPLEVALKDEPGLEMTGEIMPSFQESIKVAFSLIKRSLYLFTDQKNFFNYKGFHIHIPMVPGEKKGPSGGLSIFLAMASCLLRRSFPDDLVMTGEIGLNGQILPVGGLKEKFHAAERLGKKRIFLSYFNKKNVNFETSLQVFYFKNVYEIVDILFIEERQQDII